MCGFCCHSRKSPSRPTLKHNEPWLCRTDYPRVIVILLTNSLILRSHKYHCLVDRLNPRTTMPAFQPTVCLKCSSVTAHNNEQKQPSKVMGGQEKSCMPNSHVWWQQTKYIWQEDIGHAKRHHSPVSYI